MHHNLIRVPHGCPTVEKAMNLAKILSEPNVLSARPVNIKVSTRTLRPVARLVLQGNIPRVPVLDRVQHALLVNSTVIAIK